MNADSSGSYLREPSVSEGALKSRIEALIADIPLNERTVVERDLSFEDEIADINLARARKEVEASLGHKINNQVRVTMRYNPNWSTFDVGQIQFALPGTVSLIARADYDSGSDSYASYLYDEYDADSKQQLARKPIQTSTIHTLLQHDPFITSVTATTQSELLLELFRNAPEDTDLTIRQSAVLFEDEMPGDIVGTCSIERTQEYSQDDILDVIKFVNEVHMQDTSLARIITVFTSQNGSSISAEEITKDNLTGNTKKNPVEFDYDTLEKLIKQVDIAHARLSTAD